MPYLKEARDRGATFVVVDPRARRWPARPTSTSRCGPAPTSSSRSPSTATCSRAAPPTRRSWPRTRPAPTAARAGRAVDVRARRRGQPASRRPTSSARRALRDGVSPALVKCGWGLERNRNGGNAALAVLALPAVGGKFGVRGGGYAMSNSGAWGIDRTWLRDAGAADPRRQHEPRRPRAARAEPARRSACSSSTTATPP